MIPIWVDLETTGLDPEKDRILEIGVAVFDSIGNPRFTMDGILPLDTYRSARISNDSFIYDMHSKSGLLQALKNNEYVIAENERGLDSQLVDFANMVRAEFMDGDLLLAGSGVASFDRLFIRRWLPQFNAQLHYSHLDMGIFRRTIEQMLPDSNPGNLGPVDKAHRAFQDVQDAHAEFERYSDWLQHRS